MSSKQLNVPFDRACDFVIKIGEAAHGYGSSAPRLESFLSSLMRSFGYMGGVISTPQTMIFVLQENDDKPQRMHVLSSLDTGFDLDKLALIGDLIEDVINERATIDDALSVLRKLVKPLPHGVRWQLPFPMQLRARVLLVCYREVGPIFSSRWH